MTDKLHCPFCQQELIREGMNHWWCSCNIEHQGKELYGTTALWQALIQSLKDREELAIKLAQTTQILELSEKCCSAWETQALDYKAETIALSGKLEIATKALEEIDTTRCIPLQTLISLGKLSKTTRFNAGNIICVTTPDYTHSTLEQIKHKGQQ